MSVERRLLIERLFALTAAALELTEDLASREPGSFDEVEEQDLRDLTMMLRRATQLSAAMTGRRKVEERLGHLDRVARRHIDSARIAAMRLADSASAPAWAAEAARRLEDAVLYIESESSPPDAATHGDR